MGVCSSTEMGARGASHLGTGDHGPKTDRSRPRSVPVNALVGSKTSHSVRPRNMFTNKWVSMGLISPEPLSLTMHRAAPLDFEELARASGVARQSLTLEFKGSRPEV